MNVLLTCAGRRNYLIHYFRHALNGEGKIMAADLSSQAAAMQEADVAFEVPRVDAPEYIDSLLEICRQNDVKLLLSLNDLELPLLAKHREAFLAQGTVVVVSSEEVINTCFDKWATVRFLTQSKLPSPKTFVTLGDAIKAIEEGTLQFPVVVKPRWGSASIGLEFPRDIEELKLAYQLLNHRLSRTILAQASAQDIERAILIQEHLDGQEYGLDIINDLEGNFVTTFVKQKLGMRAGETDKAKTVDDTRLFELGKTIGTNLRHIGNLDCDVFVNDSGAWVLELNPRFGGGYPFSHEAGANLPAALVAWFKGESPQPEWFHVQYDRAFAKCDRLISIKS